MAAEFTADRLGGRASSRQLCQFRLESLVNGFHASRCRLQVNVTARMGQYQAGDPERQAQQQRLREAARRINQQYAHHFIAQVEQVLSESFRCLSSWGPGGDSPPRPSTAGIGGPGGITNHRTYSAAWHGDKRPDKPIGLQESDLGKRFGTRYIVSAGLTFELIPSYPSRLSWAKEQG